MGKSMAMQTYALADSGLCSFAYGMIFLSNEAFPLVFGSGNNGHNWSQYVAQGYSAL